ncbi:hypothetical protein MRB53_038460 [Persea americana]|nr:hypothetical protein MRB53_038460 [Persea americana]
MDGETNTETATTAVVELLVDDDVAEQVSQPRPIMQATTPHQFPTAEMFGEVVEVKTVEGSFLMHRGVLKFYSGYFAGILEEDTFKEGREGVIDLSRQDKETFKTFLHWMYTRQIPKDIQPRKELALFAVTNTYPCC